MLFQKSCRFVEDHFYFLGSLFVLNYLTAFCNILYAETGWNVVIKLTLAALSSFFIAFVLVLPLLFLPARGKKLYRGVCLACLLLLNVLEVFILYHFHSLMISSFFVVFLQTNLAETTEFLHVYFSWKTLIVFIIGSLSGWYAFYKISNKRYGCLFVRKSIRKILTLCFILGCLSGAGVTVYIQYRYMKGVVSQRTTTPLQRFIYALLDGRNDVKTCRSIASEMQDVNPLVEIDSVRLQNVVLIIGESLGKNHMSLYGYPYQTTPCLDSLFRRDELIRFNEVITSATTTVESLKAMLTFYNRDAVKKWYEYPLLPVLMKQAGYTTTWISNQESSGLWGNLLSTIAQKCDQVAYNNLRPTNDNIEGAYDLQLLPLIEKHWKQEGSNFMIIHLMGSHLSYSKRYPSDFNQFRETDYQDILNRGEKCTDYLRIKAAYDNSVLYNDFVIGQFLQFFKDKEAMVCYVADHGEEVYDYRNFMGHGQMGDLSRYMVEIPMLIWMSESYRKLYPQQAEKLKKSVDKPYMTDDLIHSFVDILGIKTPFYDPLRSIVNERYNPNRKRLVNGKINYDTSLKNRH